MFEKCGLRDIFAKIWRYKWLILILIVLFGGIGAASYMKEVRASAAEEKEEAVDDRTIYAGYAYYYVNYLKDNTTVTDSIIKSTADSYIRTMWLYPSRASIFNELKQNHTKEELAELIDKEVFANGITRFSIKKCYTVTRDKVSPYILCLRVSAETSEMCQEFLLACRNKLVKIDEGLSGSKLTYEGNYIVQEKANAYKEETEEPQDVSGPSKRTILIWLIIGLMLGLILAVVSALLRPVINRASDLNAYGPLSIGEVDKKSVPILARLFHKRFESENGKTIVFAASSKNGKKAEEICRQLAEEWKKLGKEVGYGEGNENALTLQVACAPDQNGEASDLCEKADYVITAERKGVSAHKRYDEMLHYLELLGIRPAGAVLIK